MQRPIGGARARAAPAGIRTPARRAGATDRGSFAQPWTRARRSAGLLLDEQDLDASLACDPTAIAARRRTHP